MEKEIIWSWVWGILFMVILITLVFLYAFLPMIEQKENKELREQMDFRWKDRQSSIQKLVDETGIPQEYSCEEIKIMYISDYYPPHTSTYHCKDSPESEYIWCRTVTNSNTKEVFVKYYILNCLEEKDEPVGVQER